MKEKKKHERSSERRLVCRPSHLTCATPALVTVFSFSFPHQCKRKFSLTDAFSLSISNGWKQASPSHNGSERNCTAYIEKETLTSAAHYPILFLSFLLQNNNTPALRLLNACTKGLRKPTACFLYLISVAIWKEWRRRKISDWSVDQTSANPSCYGRDSETLTIINRHLRKKRNYKKQLLKNWKETRTSLLSRNVPVGTRQVKSINGKCTVHDLFS